MLETKEGMPSGASPSLVAWILEYYLMGALGIPNLRVLSLLIILISMSHPKLENFNHTKLNVVTRPKWIEVSVLQCHPWIDNADTHSTRMDL